jgi:hypothetical protein
MMMMAARFVRIAAHSTRWRPARQREGGAARGRIVPIGVPELWVSL